MSSSSLPTYFLSHGVGPWPYMKDEFGGLFDKLEASLGAIRRELGEPPRAVLLISGHWENQEFTVSAGARPATVHDYCGFPEHVYQIKYDAPGSPTLTEKVLEMLDAGGLTCWRDKWRGFDHGTFSLLKPIFPQADVPVVQLSLKAGFDPEIHMQAGWLLAPLREEGVLILGSGSSFRIPQRKSASATPCPQSEAWMRLRSSEFDAWLQETLVRSTPAERRCRLENWASAPGARTAHPREEHLLPLMVVIGAAEDASGACVYHEDDFMGCMSVSSFRFGGGSGVH
jgi:aromatic ring-opening dioxygenase catalytic subunit (LigB family)